MLELLRIYSVYIIIGIKLWKFTNLNTHNHGHTVLTFVVLCISTYLIQVQKIWVNYWRAHFNVAWARDHLHDALSMHLNQCWITINLSNKTYNLWYPNFLTVYSYEFMFLNENPKKKTNKIVDPTDFGIIHSVPHMAGSFSFFIFIRT